MRTISTHTNPRFVANDETWCNRNGTYLRVLIAIDLNDPPPNFDTIDIVIHRIVILTCGNIADLDERTRSLQAAGVTQNIQLVSADGHHRTLIDQIAVANSQRADHGS